MVRLTILIRSFLKILRLRLISISIGGLCKILISINKCIHNDLAYGTPLMASPWGPNSDIMDQRWNKVSAHVDWISKIIKGTKAEQCDTAVSPGP